MAGEVEYDNEGNFIYPKRKSGFCISGCMTLDGKHYKPSLPGKDICEGCQWDYDHQSDDPEDERQKEDDKYLCYGAPKCPCNDCHAIYRC